MNSAFPDARADEIAAAVLWPCSSAASLIGVAVPVDGGYTAR